VPLGKWMSEVVDSSHSDDIPVFSDMDAIPISAQAVKVALAQTKLVRMF
jgi:hypothetical protein